MTSSKLAVALGVGMYMACSSLALVSNKVTFTYFPTPGIAFCIQLVATVAFIYLGNALGRLAVDPITWPNVRVFLPYICSFTISLYSNGRALAHSNVETVIVFRSCSPLLVSVLDWMFLGRDLPSLRSIAALSGVVVGAIGYVLVDSEFAARGLAAYFWVTLNLAGIVFEMTYGKRLISCVSFEAPVWGSVLYTNILALAPMFCMALGGGEPERFIKTEVSIRGIAWLVLSCIIGVGISWSGWNCRSQISATTYTLIGVVCKFVSVLLNMALWDKHATPMGLMMLSLCLLSSSAYQQAPERAALAKEAVVGDYTVVGRSVHEAPDGPESPKDWEVPDGPESPKEAEVSGGPEVPDSPKEAEMPATVGSVELGDVASMSDRLSPR